jgi:hypothetical protein
MTGGPWQERRAAGRGAVVLGLAALALCLLAACRTAPESAVDATVDRLDRTLRWAASERPDSIVGVLVLTREPVTPRERRALEKAGLAIGTVAGTVVTGRIRAGAAPALARHAFVVRVEAAGELRPQPSAGPAEGPAARRVP